MSVNLLTPNPQPCELLNRAGGIITYGECRQDAPGRVPVFNSPLPLDEDACNAVATIRLADGDELTVTDFRACGAHYHFEVEGPANS